MGTNIIKKARVNEVDALQKLADGLTQNASTAPSFVLAGTTLKPTDVVAKLQARLAQLKAVTAAAAAWHAAVQTDKTAAEQIKPLVAAVKQVLLAAYAGQLDVLAEYGLTPRKTPVISPATRTAAALKAKATRAARGTMGKVQKAAITAQVAITPATATPVTATPIKSATAAPAATASSSTGASAPPTPVTASPTPASPPAAAAHS
jgi:hypothetical protein